MAGLANPVAQSAFYAERLVKAATKSNDALEKIKIHCEKRIEELKKECAWGSYVAPVLIKESKLIKESNAKIKEVARRNNAFQASIRSALKISNPSDETCLKGYHLLHIDDVSDIYNRKVEDLETLEDLEKMIPALSQQERTEIVALRHIKPQQKEEKEGAKGTPSSNSV
jgi:hypothetical protein